MGKHTNIFFPLYVYVCIYVYKHRALQKYWNSKDKITLLAVESRHLQIWLKDEYETKLQNVTFYYWVIKTDVLRAKKFSTFRVSSPWSDASISIGTVASRVFLSDQLCPVALILQILKAGNVSYQLHALLLYSESCIWRWHTQTRMKMRELTERKVSNLEAKRKESIRALAKTKDMKKSRVWKPSATNNDLIGWENNSSWWQTNHKSCENQS